ncbi:hypothetical protein Nepgr_021902 [Nepenthes gracilis]|uniref:Uncharacterized protein n=1 Tax=Nepenthes gracilis TaxID=150966 RepID=A0AAD3T1N4_NEPGR|nr:hypothetical protein Nepgr_021902 [Nepenthes gracilis]
MEIPPPLRPQVSAVIFPVDAVASLPVRSTSYRIAHRTLLKRRCRTRRRSPSSGGSIDEGPFDGDRSGNDGSSSGGGVRRWNFGGFGGFDSDDSSSYLADPAFDFVYEVVCWIVFSNCVHFAFKKVVRIISEEFYDQESEKVPMRLASVS